MVSTIKFSFSSPMLHVSAIKGCHLHDKFVNVLLGMHVKGVGNLINDFYAICHSFLYLIGCESLPEDLVEVGFMSCSGAV